jgi:hypothetical protein
VKAPTQTVASIATADIVTIVVHRAAPGWPKRIRVPNVHAQHPRQIARQTPKGRIRKRLLMSLSIFHQRKARLTKVK